MQHKPTNFEFIYFLEEINFLKVTSLKIIIALTFLFFVVLNSMKLLIVYLQRTYFIYCQLKKKKEKTTYYLTFL